jgi:hypothetical protein
VVKQAAFAEAGAAIITTELIAVPDVLPAFAAFYGSVDELKHHLSLLRASGKNVRRSSCAVQQMRLSTLSPHPAMKKMALRNFFGRVSHLP